MRCWRRAGGLLLATVLAVGCRSSQREALALLQISAAPELTAVTSVRLSVDERPQVRAREVSFDPSRPLEVGYYLPGPDGAVTIRAQGIAATGCVVGEGIATVDVRVGQASAVVPLGIAPVKVDSDGCRSGDGAAGEDATEVATDEGSMSGPADAAADLAAADDANMSLLPDAASAPLDTTAPDLGPYDTAPPSPDVAPPPRDTAPPPPPACLPAVAKCGGAAACCPGLRCGSSSAGPQICCGDFNAACSRANGEDCCGKVLPCTNGRCCLPAVWYCTGQGNECCDGRVCGTSSAGRVCCGNAGAYCNRGDSKDCCGNLVCRNNRCS
jgi:hypothetical protein